MRAPMQYVRTTTTPIAMGAAQNIATLARLGISPKNVTFTTVAPLQGSDAAMEHGSSVRYTPNTDPTAVQNVTRNVGMQVYFENLLDAHSAEQFFDEGFRAKVPTQRTSISASAVNGGASSRCPSIKASTCCTDRPGCLRPPQMHCREPPPRQLLALEASAPVWRWVSWHLVLR